MKEERQYIEVAIKQVKERIEKNKEDDNLKNMEKDYTELMILEDRLFWLISNE